MKNDCIVRIRCDRDRGRHLVTSSAVFPKRSRENKALEKLKNFHSTIH